MVTIKVYQKFWWPSRYTFFFVLEANNSRKLVEDSSIPKFYKECILYFQELTRKGKYIQNNNNEILWGNHKFQFNNESLMFPHWAKSGIKYVKDIIKDGELISNQLYDKLIYKARFTFEIQRIRRSLPAEWLRMDHSDDRENTKDNSILNTMFQISGEGLKPLHSLTAKEIYKILVNSNDMCVRSKEYWSDRFSNLIPLLIGKYGFMWIFPMCACLENVETSTGNCFMDVLILKWGLSEWGFQMVFVKCVAVMKKMLNICCIHVPNYLVYGKTWYSSSTMFLKQE